MFTTKQNLPSCVGFENCTASLRFWPFSLGVCVCVWNTRRFSMNSETGMDEAHSCTKEKVSWETLRTSFFQRFIYFNEWIQASCLSVNGRYSGCLKRPEGSFRCPGARVTDGYEILCGCWSFRSGPLEVLLTSESFLSPERHFSKTILLILEEFNAIFYGQNFIFISFYLVVNNQSLGV